MTAQNYTITLPDGLAIVIENNRTIFRDTDADETIEIRIHPNVGAARAYAERLAQANGAQNPGA